VFTDWRHQVAEDDERGLVLLLVDLLHRDVAPVGHDRTYRPATSAPGRGYVANRKDVTGVSGCSPERAEADHPAGEDGLCGGAGGATRR
jgi:hypothetical protein